MKGKYIFYVFNTLTWNHVEMALESIARQDFDETMAFALYNVSTFDSTKILSLAMDTCGSKFHCYGYWENIRPTTSTVEDINMHIYATDRDNNADWYLTHKADFYLGKDAIHNAAAVLKTDKPIFLNFCKFDLREKIVGDGVRQLARLKWDEILSVPGTVDISDSTPDDWGIKYDKIGYRGIDGVMHGYTESARKLLVFDTFINAPTVAQNIAYGVKWLHNNTDIYALHMFHELPGGRNSEKDIMGYRF